MMNFSDYQRKAARTLQCEMTPIELISNLVFGLAGETGEIADLLKKAIFHKHDLNQVKLAYELGDLLWYLCMIAEYYHIDMAQVARLNIDKLAARYPNGFSYKDSRKRLDVHTDDTI